MTLLCLCCWELVCTCSFHWLRGNLAALRIPTADAAAEADLEWNFPPVLRLGPGANGRSENLSRTQEGEWEEGWEDSQRGRGREARSGHYRRHASLRFKTNCFHHHHHNRGLSRGFKGGKKLERSENTEDLSVFPPISLCSPLLSVFCPVQCFFLPSSVCRLLLLTLPTLVFLSVSKEIHFLSL